MTRAAFAALLTALVCASAAGQTFTRHSKWFKVGPNVTAIAAADLNGDGLPEIVTADRGKLADPREERPAQNQLSYLVAQGNLEYLPQPQLPTGFAPYAITVANIDALKAQDLVVANFLATRDRDLTLLRNLGNHLFEPIHFSVPDEGMRYTKMRDGDGLPVFTTPGLTSLAVVDLDGDGYRDVVATGWCSDVIVFFPGVADTYFGDPVLSPAPGGPRDVKTADFDGDGTPDLATTLYSTNEIALWRGDPSGRFTEAARFSSRGRLPQKILIADLNGDAKQDLIVSHSHADDSIVIFFGDGGFKFSVSQEIMLGKERRAIEYGIKDIVVADFNRDGKADLAAACHDARKVVVLINTSKDNRVPQSFSRETYRYDDARPQVLCVSDFNVDGKPDLGVALWDANSVALLLGR